MRRMSRTSQVETRATIETLVERVRAEYVEMPGLCLTFRQAQRLWGLDDTECDKVLRALVEAGFLLETHQGCFVRAADRLHALVRERMS